MRSAIDTGKPTAAARRFKVALCKVICNLNQRITEDANMLSDEQKAVVEAPLRGVTMVHARAGAGKTTSLVAKAERHAAIDGMRGLYVAFAKPAQLDAAQRFGRSALCKTGHALAFPRFGQKYAHKLRAVNHPSLKGGA